MITAERELRQRARKARAGKGSKPHDESDTSKGESQTA